MIFTNTFPKSGTGLIRQILSAVADDAGHFGMFDGGTGQMHNHRDLCQTIRRLGNKPDGFCTMHLHWRPDFNEMLAEEKVIMLVRDPRDVIVSHANYITDTPAHHLHPRYEISRLGDYEKNILRSIRGMPGASYDFPDIANRFLPYLGWMHQDWVLVVRFEDLIEHQERTVKRIAAYIGVEEAAKEMIAGIQPEKSQTFREGKTGSWTENFSIRNQRYWEDNFQWLLDVMSYEEVD